MERLRRIPVRPVLAVLGAAFFFAPALAFLGGERAEPIENRRLAAFPSLSRGFNVFDDLTQWGVDHLPLRDSAVRVHSRVSRELLGEVPVVSQVTSPVGIGPAASTDAIDGQSVVVGRDGWLFLSKEFELACRPGRSRDEVIAAVRRLESIVRRSGRRFVLGIAPDKAAVVPDLVAGDYPLKECAERARAERTALLDAARLPGFVDIERALEAEQRRTRGPIYLKFDTHWSDLGGIVAAKSIVRAVDPSLLGGASVVRLPDQKQVEDLAFIIGDTEPRAQRRHRLVRRGVKVTQLEGAAGDLRSTARARRPRAQLYEEDALIFGDSFAKRSYEQFRPFFADLTFLPAVTSPASAAARSQTFLTEQVRGSELFVVLAGERGFWSRQPHTVLSDQFLDELEKAIPPDRG